VPGAPARPRRALGREPAVAVEGLPSVQHGVARLLALATTNWIVVGALAAYLLTAFVVPTMAPVPISDDWVYARSVEILVQQHHLHILDNSTAIVIFQVVWGALFATLLGMSFGVLRLATVALVFLSGIAVYGLCRELHAGRPLSALATAVYLFNPLNFVLSYTFMSDPYFTALLVISSYFYVRGILRADSGWRWTLVGSLVASLAFLVRQQGVLIPIALATALLLLRRLTFNWAGIVRLLQVAGLPLFTFLAYYSWLKLSGTHSLGQAWYLQALSGVPITSFAKLTARLSFIEVMYAGFFILPLAIAAAAALPQVVRRMRPAGWVVFVLFEAVLVGTLGLFSVDGRRMPYVPHFFSRAGLGPQTDVAVGRGEIFPAIALVILTLACAVAAMSLAFFLLGRSSVGRRALAAGPLAVGGLLFWQALGTIPPSINFRDWTYGGLSSPSLDRYLLPLLPLAIALFAWALRDFRLFLPLGWVAAAAMAAFAIAGTHDSLTFQQAVWHMDREATAAGIDKVHLDGGAQWDGYYLYEYSLATNSPVKTPGGSWWLYLFAPADDSTYMVSAGPVPKYEVVKRERYQMWLDPGPSYIYLLRRHGATGPL
jgi:hypothetical protein